VQLCYINILTIILEISTNYNSTLVKKVVHNNDTMTIIYSIRRVQDTYVCMYLSKIIAQTEEEAGEKKPPSTNEIRSEIFSN
jgi:hypothetical protein